MDRRRFLQSIAAAALSPVTAQSCASSTHALRADPAGVLDLPGDFTYRVVSRSGDSMSDGLRVPRNHDGMAAFARDDGRIALICNHESVAGHPEQGAFIDGYERVPASMREKIYDRGGDRNPLPGGTTTTIWNPVTQETERQFLSLGGTELNCAGGPTPWGSWLSCEETFTSPGEKIVDGTEVRRDRRHGYVFEVPATADELVPAEPLRALGRFEHEAAAVDPASSVVYLTEDRHHGLLYRFIPDAFGNLRESGRLQALTLIDAPSARTHNWSANPDIGLKEPREAGWIDIDEPDLDKNQLRRILGRKGATTFARGEGICHAGDRFAFTCTEGGAARLGQVFTYRPTSDDGGELELIAEVQPDSIFRHCDNITMAPWGDLIVCEDRGRHSGLVGIRPSGEYYRIAANPYSNSELAGACFSPDGETLFVNIQYPGATLAISGPWSVLTTRGQ